MKMIVNFKSGLKQEFEISNEPILKITFDEYKDFAVSCFSIRDIAPSDIIYCNKENLSSIIYRCLTKYNKVEINKKL